MKTKEKNKNNRGFKIFLVFLVLSILILADENIQKAIINRIKKVNIGIKSIDFKVSESIPISGEILDIGNYKGIVLWDGKKLIKIDNNGDIIKEKEFNLEDTHLHMGQDRIYVYEKPSGDIYILNEEMETIDRIKLEGRIENIVESFDYILVHTKEDYGESLKILNKTGQIIENIITENRNILTYSTNKEGNKYTISTLSFEDTTIRSQIQTFEIGGQSIFDHSFKDEIILYTKYISQDKLIIMTDKNIYCISGDEVIWNKSYESLKDIYVDNEDIYLLYSNSLDVITENGDIKYNYSFSEEYRKILVYDKFLIAYGEEYIIGIMEQEEVFKYNAESTILKAIKDGKRLMILYSDKIDLATF